MELTMNITKNDLIDYLCEKTEYKREIITFIFKEMLNTITNELAKGNKVEFRNFGNWKIKQRKPRIAQNPKTLEKVNVPAKKTCKFKIGKKLKEDLQKEKVKKKIKVDFDINAIIDKYKL